MHQKDKAELFDYLAERATEIKMKFDFGGTDWVYIDRPCSLALAKALLECMLFEKNNSDA